MKKVIRKISQAVQVVLAAPIKLPAKVVQVVRYVALSLGILEAIVPDHDEDEVVNKSETFVNDESLLEERSEDGE